MPTRAEIENQTAGAVAINALGVEVTAGAGQKEDISDFQYKEVDLAVPELVTLIDASTIKVLDFNGDNIASADLDQRFIDIWLPFSGPIKHTIATGVTLEIGSDESYTVTGPFTVEGIVNNNGHLGII